MSDHRQSPTIGTPREHALGGDRPPPAQRAPDEGRHQIHGNQRWRFTFGPAVFAETGLRLMLATGLMSRSIIERAHQEREAILAELERPLAMLRRQPSEVPRECLTNSRRPA